MTGNRFVAFTALMCHRALLAAALLVTRLAPSGSHLYSIHIWLHAWTDTTLFVDGTQRAIRIDLMASDAAPLGDGLFLGAALGPLSASYSSVLRNVRRR